MTKWMRNGACDYLIKPIRPEDLRLIYKYLVKKMELRGITVAEEAEEKAAAEKSSSVGDSTIRSPNRRKRNMLQTDEEDPDHNRDSATKKRRVVWDDYLNGKFLDAVNSLGNNGESRTLGFIVTRVCHFRFILYMHIYIYIQNLLYPHTYIIFLGILISLYILIKKPV